MNDSYMSYGNKSSSNLFIKNGNSLENQNVKFLIIILIVIFIDECQQ
jgi:hypothetical protein